MATTATATVTVPADGSTVTLDPGTCYTATVTNTGSVNVRALAYVGESDRGQQASGGLSYPDGALLAPGEHRVIYPGGPITARTDTGTAGQVTVLTYSR